MRRIPSACEKTMKKQEPCDLSYFRNMELFSEYAYMLLPGIVDRSEITLDYSLNWLYLFIYMSL